MENKLFASIKTMLTSMFGMDEESTVQEVQQRLADEEVLIDAAVKEAEASTRELVEGERQEEIDQLNARIADLEENNKTLTTEKADLTSKLSAAETENEELKKEPDGTQAEGEKVPPKNTKKKKSYLSTGVNARMQAELDRKYEAE